MYISFTAISKIQTRWGWEMTDLSGGGLVVVEMVLCVGGGGAQGRRSYSLIFLLMCDSLERRYLHLFFLIS